MKKEDPLETGAGGRDQARSSLFIAAVMRSGSEQVPVKVRNMSLNGALIETPLAPSVGTEVQLIRGALVAIGTVMWSFENRCGLRFASDISIKQWLEAPSKAEQQRVDEIVSLVKAGAIPGAFSGRHKAGSKKAYESQLVDSLNAVVKLLSHLEVDLCSSPETLERHGRSLQNLDIALQVINAVMSELSGDQGRGAYLDDLRLVCAQALRSE